MFAEPVDHVLVRCGLCSVRSASVFLKNNDVCINGTRALLRSTPVDSERDCLVVNGSAVFLPRHIYLMMNKASGTVCSRTGDSHILIYDVLPAEIKNHALFDSLHSAGRLDCGTSGLIFLTTNGMFSNRLSSPDYHIPKTYKVLLSSAVSSDLQRKYTDDFRRGVFIPPEKKSPAFTSKGAELVFMSDCECVLTIHEGKFHQVRRMFSAVDNEVAVLERIAVGNITLPAELGKNCVRRLSDAEIKYFENLSCE